MLYLCYFLGYQLFLSLLSWFVSWKRKESVEKCFSCFCWLWYWILLGHITVLLSSMLTHGWAESIMFIVRRMLDYDVNGHWTLCRTFMTICCRKPRNPICLHCFSFSYKWSMILLWYLQSFLCLVVLLLHDGVLVQYCFACSLTWVIVYI